MSITEKQIIDAATKHCEQFDSDQDLSYSDFTEGDKWAISQMQPEWVACADRLPELKEPDDMVKLLGWDGVQTLRVDYYKYEDESTGRFRVSCLKCFNDVTDLITHWMPLPQPPTK